MISTENIMIGDWLYCDGLRKPVRVQAIPSKTFVVVKSTEDGETKNGVAATVAALHYIRLTSEALEHNGFHRSEWRPFFISDDPAVDDANLSIFPSPKEPSEFFVYDCHFVCNIQYVHELQHILKLVGSTKRIHIPSDKYAFARPTERRLQNESTYTARRSQDDKSRLDPPSQPVQQRQS